MECPWCSTTISDAPKPFDLAVFSVCNHCMNPVVLRYKDALWRVYPPKGVQDIRQMAQEASIGRMILEHLPEEIERLPLLPEIAQRILLLLRNPEVSPNAMVDLISQDQVIALKILKLANSPVYGGLTEIRDLRAACARLGLRTIANTIQAIANGRLYQVKNSPFREMMSDLWRHSLASAHCACEIAVLVAQPAADVLFVSGLIHDIGKLVLLDMVTTVNTPMMMTLRDSPELYAEVQAGFHGIIGLHVVHRWNLPPEFGVTTYCHDQVNAVPDEAWLARVHIVSLASALANASGYGKHPSGLSLLGLPSTKYLGLNDIKLATLRIDLEDKLAPLFEVATAC